MESILVLLFAVVNSHGLASLLQERQEFTQPNGLVKLLLQTRHATKSGGEVEHEGKLSLPPSVDTFNPQPGDPSHMVKHNVSDNCTTEIFGLYNPAASESMINTSLSFSFFETPAKIFGTAINEMINMYYEQSPVGVFGLGQEIPGAFRFGILDRLPFTAPRKLARPGTGNPRQVHKIITGDAGNVKDLTAHAGSLTLGGIDVGKYYGPMNHVHLLEDPTHQHSTSYCVSLAKLQILVSDSDSMVALANDDRPACFNTRNRLTRFPAEAFDVIIGIFDPYSLPKAGRDGEVLYSLPCSFDGAEYIRFGFGGAGDLSAFDIDVAIEDLILDPVADAESQGACLFGISRGDAGTDFILGETFLAAVTGIISPLRAMARMQTKEQQPCLTWIRRLFTLRPMLTAALTWLFGDRIPSTSGLMSTDFGSSTASPSDVAIPTIALPSIAVSSGDSWNTLSDATYGFSSTSSAFLKTSVSHDNLTTTITVRRTRSITVSEAPDSSTEDPYLRATASSPDCESFSIIIDSISRPGETLPSAIDSRSVGSQPSSTTFFHAEPSLLVPPILQDSEAAFETNAPGIIRTGLVIASSSTKLAGPGAGGDKDDRLRPDVSPAVEGEEFR
ncbi:hypothetical protein BN1723_013280 [Verticillium longisporum]|uniref:Peptidase A1 domain-containing protein n=1 Tax=Verticillium longisporum TaxID=100787 RepID=A0A0G4LRW3_VERLO|nr:hypothetical protein BN1723_013280 [Verticillium longisporum]